MNNKMYEMMKPLKSILIAAAALIALSPLGQMRGAQADAISRPEASLSDAQIAKIVHTANDGEIKQARLAEKNSSNPDVRSFAKMMIEQHSQVNDELRQVTKSEKIQPRNSSDASSLRSDADQTFAKLKALKGADFDRAYADAQVKAHQGVLDSIDQTLLPSARDGKLQAMLQKVRPAVAAHLEHAKKLQTEIAGTPQTG